MCGMSQAANIRLVLQNQQTSGLPDREIAELCGTSVTNVKMTRLRLKKGTKEDRLTALERRVEILERANMSASREPIC